MSPRRLGLSPRRLGLSPRRLGLSPRRLGLSPRRRLTSGQGKPVKWVFISELWYYYLTGELRQANDRGILVQGGYKLRPTLAIMYYVYQTVGFGFLGLSVLATLRGTAAWAAMAGMGPAILLSGLKMLAVSIGYLALGWGHITLEKWLDGRNRHAVQALLDRAAGKT